MRNVLKWLLAVPLLAALVIPVVGWQLETRRMQRGWSQSMARNRDRPIPVRTVAVVEKDGIDIVGATCVSQPSAATPIIAVSYNTDVMARIVRQVNFREGDPVKKGDIIVEFDRDIFEQATRTAKSNTELLQAQVENIKKILPDGAASNLELSVAKSELESANFQLKLSQKDLEQCTIRAPFDGVISDLSLAAGAQVTNTQEICTIFSLDPILVKVEYPIERLDAVAIGDKMTVIFDSFPDESHHGNVVSISPLAKAQTRVLNVYVQIANPDLRLKGGITGYARLQRKKRAVTIPRTAIMRRKGKAVVFKIVNDEARIVEVRTGSILTDGELELLEGLKQGDEIVVFGQDELSDGDKVNSDWLRWANRDDKTKDNDNIETPREKDVSKRSSAGKDRVSGPLMLPPLESPSTPQRGDDEQQAEELADGA